MNTMLNRFNLDNIKRQAVEKLTETGDDLSSKALEIKDSISTDTNNAVSKAKNAVNSIKESIDETKDLVKDFSVEKVKEFAVNSSIIVGEIDEYLVEKNLPYEVSSFRVSANMGVMVGMILDIQFSKTLNAKKNSFDKRAANNLTNPESNDTENNDNHFGSIWVLRSFSKEWKAMRKAELYRVF
jgi:ElaB/YqjD/DUF883 family membrane-anchored ribosome-binding protein